MFDAPDDDVDDEAVPDAAFAFDFEPFFELFSPIFLNKNVLKIFFFVFFFLN